MVYSKILECLLGPKVSCWHFREGEHYSTHRTLQKADEREKSRWMKCLLYLSRILHPTEDKRGTVGSFFNLECCCTHVQLLGFQRHLFHHCGNSLFMGHVGEIATEALSQGHTIMVSESNRVIFASFSQVNTLFVTEKLSSHVSQNCSFLCSEKGM